MTRSDELLRLVSTAMGKQAVRTEEAPAGDRPEDFEPEPDEPEEEPSVETPITTATRLPDPAGAPSPQSHPS